MTNTLPMTKSTQQIQCFTLFSLDYGDVRSFIIEEKPWFAGKDVASALGFKSANTALKRILSPADQRIVCRSELPHYLPPGMRVTGIGLTAINESAVIDLAIRSRKRNASDFRHWLFDKALEFTSILSKPINPEDKIMESRSTTPSGVQIFRDPEFGNLRRLVVDGEAWFIGKDVAVALGYSDTKQAIRVNVDAEDKKHLPKSAFGGCTFTTSEINNNGATVINESGLYAMIFGSKLESAKHFKHWVTSEVLPSLRKYDSYTVPGMQNTTVTIPRIEYEELLSFKSKWSNLGDSSIQAIKACAEKLNSQETQIKLKETEPVKSNVVQSSFQKILPKPYIMDVGQFAKLLKPAYPVITRNKLFQWLREEGYLDPNNTPIQEYKTKGYLDDEERMTSQGLYIKPLVTPKGQSYFIKVLEEQHRGVN